MLFVYFHFKERQQSLFKLAFFFQVYFSLSLPIPDHPPGQCLVIFDVLLNPQAKLCYFILHSGKEGEHLLVYLKMKRAQLVIYSTYKLSWVLCSDFSQISSFNLKNLNSQIRWLYLSSFWIQIRVDKFLQNIYILNMSF